MPNLYPRLDTKRVRSALTDTPVVLLNGPCQSGKTTLARDLLGAARTFRTLDALALMDDRRLGAPARG